MERISLKSARRIALAAQGFGEARPAGEVGARQMARAIDRLGLLQIDSVSVLVRAHYMPLFSRLGAYPRDRLESFAWKRPRRLFEYWAHEASLLPVETWPLVRWRMRKAERGEGIYAGLARFGHERSGFIEGIFREVEARGPVGSSQFDGDKGEGGWWGWSETKRALEWLFWAGRITTHSRRGFERLYDLPERVLPPSVLAAPEATEAEAHRALIGFAARALGVATTNDLRDYHRLSPEPSKIAVAELVEAGELAPVAVEGWAQAAYLHRDARRPRRIQAAALLSPFDPLVFERSRTERLFGFRYRIEIYVPAEKRVHGYYVLPFLLDEALVARVDLKADRPAGCLLVQAAHAEPGAPPETAAALAAELIRMAGWLGLERIVVGQSGDLAAALAAEVTRLHGGLRLSGES